ncbi:MAG: 16S rRNA (guanine1207-N2)-methyltransferase [Bradymonadia bacterium]|jgi:16S rRNA (guanine1207-N2)-methyltransferase
MMATETLPPGEGTLLIVGDDAGVLSSAAREKGWQPRVWSRWCRGEQTGTPWPTGKADAAVIRLPKAKAALRFAMHAAASVVGDGPVYVYGSKDEGIRSIPKVLDELFPRVDTVAIKRHCRMLVGRGAGTGVDAVAVRGALEDWAQTSTLALPSGKRPWLSYPGVFAKGGLDAGTRMLLDALPTPNPSARVLDFACGTGVIAAELRAREASISVDLLDADAVALAAAVHNVPGARRIASDAWRAATMTKYDWIVSNPPIHHGKSEDFGALTALIEEGAKRLHDGGALWLVVQRQVPVKRLFHEAGLFDVRSVAEDGRFQVWMAQ